MYLQASALVSQVNIHRMKENTFCARPHGKSQPETEDACEMPRGTRLNPMPSFMMASYRVTDVLQLSFQAGGCSVVVLMHAMHFGTYIVLTGPGVCF